MSEVVEALDRVMNRLDALEAKVDALAGGTAIAAATAPADPAERMERLLGRVDDIEATLDVTAHFARQAPLVAEAAGEGVNYFFNEAAARGIDPFERGQATLELVEQLSDPALMTLVGRLAANRERLQLLADTLDSIPAEDMQTLSTEGATAAGRVAALMRTDAYAKLAGLIDARTASVMGTAGTAMVEAGSPSALGPFGAFMAMRDPDVGKAVGFALAVAKQFGSRL